MTQRLVAFDVKASERLFYGSRAFGCYFWYRPSLVFLEYIGNPAWWWVILGALNHFFPSSHFITLIRILLIDTFVGLVIKVSRTKFSLNLYQ